LEEDPRQGIHQGVERLLAVVELLHLAGETIERSGDPLLGLFQLRGVLPQFVLDGEAGERARCREAALLRRLRSSPSSLSLSRRFSRPIAPPGVSRLVYATADS
jgi:hypothetical protein